MQSFFAMNYNLLIKREKCHMGKKENFNQAMYEMFGLGKEPQNIAQTPINVFSATCKSLSTAG